jgi:hypothetical protein
MTKLTSHAIYRSIDSSLKVKRDHGVINRSIDLSGGANVSIATRVLKSAIAAVAAIICAPSTALAANAWSAELPIDAVISQPDGGVLLLIAASNPACGSSGNQFHITPGVNGLTADGAKTAVATALLAFASGRKVVVLFDSVINGCPVQQVMLKSQ